MNDYIADVFGAGGLFASRFPGYEAREGQVALARMVDQAITDGRHALGEGPCGTGKGNSYGVPAVWHAHHRRKRIVIVTANIALQEQLVRKDLPLLASILPWKFEFALLKGRSNFLCVERLKETKASGELITLHDPRDRQRVDDILAWAEATTTGDVSELPLVPDARLWSRFSVGPEDCHGEACPSYRGCFAERAKERAEAADIVVTNYHMLFAHLAVRRETGQDVVLPRFDAAILDEAHEASDIARDFFGFTVSHRAVARLAGYAESHGGEHQAALLRHESRLFFDAVACHAKSPKYQGRLVRPGVAPTAGLVASLQEVAKLADLVAREMAVGGEVGVEVRERIEEVARARLAERQARSVIVRIEECVALGDDNKVYFVELDAMDRATLGAKPIDVAPLLRTELFNRTNSVTLVSATMTTSGTFDYIRRETGVPSDAIELVVPTPFDFRRQAILVVPSEMPPHDAPEFEVAAADAVQAVIDACAGRTLALFTSHRMLDAVHARVRGRGHRVLKQGELPRAELTRIFKEDIGSVLLGTESFWTGIDVPGEALTGLVIDKLPFPSPKDPVASAITARDRKWFQNYSLPRMIIMLRQGVGRLIRSRDDVGVVVILDQRLTTKGYAGRVLRSLPPMQGQRDLRYISAFLDAVNLEG